MPQMKTSKCTLQKKLRKQFFLVSTKQFTLKELQLLEKNLQPFPVLKYQSS